MKKNILFSLFFLTSFFVKAQTGFFSTVKIEYEKKVAVTGLYKEIIPEWFDRIKDRLPQTSTSYFEFTGDSSRSLYKLSKEAVYDARSAFQPFADKNIVYNDYTTGTTISQKPIYEETFLMEDSLLKIKWKITNDTRTIAGFECRKAVGIIFDTVAVFAFYDDELMVNGGPEGVHGLPGMILGMAIPRLHTTWFATKVQVVDINLKAIAPATKGKKVNRDTMLKSMDRVLKNWEYGKKLMLATMI